MSTSFSQCPCSPGCPGGPVIIDFFWEYLSSYSANGIACGRKKVIFNAPFFLFVTRMKHIGRIQIYIEEEYKYIKPGQGWDIISRSSALPLNFNEQRFAHFKLSSDLCHQHVTSKQILKATMWTELNTRSNSQISFLCEKSQ